MLSFWIAKSGMCHWCLLWILFQSMWFTSHKLKCVLTLSHGQWFACDQIKWGRGNMWTRKKQIGHGESEWESVTQPGGRSKQCKGGCCICECVRTCVNAWDGEKASWEKFYIPTVVSYKTMHSDWSVWLMSIRIAFIFSSLALLNERIEMAARRVEESGSTEEERGTRQRQTTWPSVYDYNMRACRMWFTSDTWWELIVSERKWVGHWIVLEKLLWMYHTVATRSIGRIL